MITKPELERLVILSEECAEVQQIISKIIRHGFDSYNPYDSDKKTNRELLETELGDLTFIIDFCQKHNDINEINIKKHFDDKKNKIQKYLHHNKVN